MKNSINRTFILIIIFLMIMANYIFAGSISFNDNPVALEEIIQLWGAASTGYDPKEVAVKLQKNYRI